MDKSISDQIPCDNCQHENSPETDQRLRQIYRTLPSYYLHWTPQLPAKQIRPPELSGPSCRPRDPSPVHYNQPELQRSRGYRRVRFNPNRRNQLRNAISHESLACSDTQDRIREANQPAKNTQRRWHDTSCQNNLVGRINFKAGNTDRLAALYNGSPMHNAPNNWQDANEECNARYRSQTDLVLVDESCSVFKDLKTDAMNGVTSSTKHDAVSQIAPWRKRTSTDKCDKAVKHEVPSNNLVNKKATERDINSSSTMFPNKVPITVGKPTQTGIHKRYEKQANQPQEYGREMPWRSPRVKRKPLFSSSSIEVMEQSEDSSFCNYMISGNKVDCVTNGNLNTKNKTVLNSTTNISTGNNSEEEMTCSSHALLSKSQFEENSKSSYKIESQMHENKKLKSSDNVSNKCLSSNDKIISSNASQEIQSSRLTKQIQTNVKDIPNAPYHEQRPVIGKNYQKSDRSKDVIETNEKCTETLHPPIIASQSEEPIKIMSAMTDKGIIPCHSPAPVIAKTLEEPMNILPDAENKLQLENINININEYINQLPVTVKTFEESKTRTCDMETIERVPYIDQCPGIDRPLDESITIVSDIDNKAKLSNSVQSPVLLSQFEEPANITTLMDNNVSFPFADQPSLAVNPLQEPGCGIYSEINTPHTDQSSGGMYPYEESGIAMSGDTKLFYTGQSLGISTPIDHSREYVDTASASSDISSNYLTSFPTTINLSPVNNQNASSTNGTIHSYNSVKHRSNEDQDTPTLKDLSFNQLETSNYSIDTDMVQTCKELTNMQNRNERVDYKCDKQQISAEITNTQGSEISAPLLSPISPVLLPLSHPSSFMQQKDSDPLSEKSTYNFHSESNVTLPLQYKLTNLKDANQCIAEAEIHHQGETTSSTLEDADYVQESITNRIQRFEKQASFEAEKPKDKALLPIAKPVGPWVKKTSSGVVDQSCWESERDEVYAENRRRERYSPSITKASPFSSTNCVSTHRTEETVNQNSEQYQTTQTQAKISHLPSTIRTQPKTNEMSDINDESAVLTSRPSLSSKTNDPLFDPWCDPENPIVIQFQDISAAAFKIKSGILNTPCNRSNMSSLVGAEIYFKKEFNQYTGSFKERGARYTLLSMTDTQKKNGVIAASAGNHALALSYHGQQLNIPITVVMPLVAPIMKVQACRQYGANVIVTGYDIGECKEIALRMGRDLDLVYLNGYDHPHILAGQGTMGLEIVEQVRDIDAVVVPVGGGGLIAGVALAVKSLYPHIKVIGVESENCASYSAAMDAGHPVKISAESSLADGLAVPCVGVNAFATASGLIDKIVKVKEEWIAIAILRLVEMEKAVVEGAGATGLAAMLAGELPELAGKRVVIPLCGGNIDTTVLGRCLERGLAADGRLVKFTVTVSDRPGGIAELTKLLCNLGVSIKDMMHERAWIKNDIFSVEVKVVCETKDYEHCQELRKQLESRYSRMKFPSPTQIAEDNGKGIF